MLGSVNSTTKFTNLRIHSGEIASCGERVDETPPQDVRGAIATQRLRAAMPPTDTSPLSGAPVSSLLPVPDMGEGVQWPFEIPIR